MSNFEDNATTIERLIEFGNTLDGAEVYFRDSWDCYYFSLLGKCFGMLGSTFITLKGEPERNFEMVNQYECVEPGYYANKRHWISVKLENTEISVGEIENLVKASYTLVFDKLTNKQRLMIADEIEKKQGPNF